jgi:hypothetical protein
MVSGVWVLKDGRGYSQSTSFMIKLIKHIHKELSIMEKAEAFTEYLKKYIFTDNLEPNGSGGFNNKATGEAVIMDIDLREFTPENQGLFWLASQYRLKKLVINNDRKDSSIIKELKILLDMNNRANRGEDPRKSNHMEFITPPTGNKNGPGWDHEN